MKFLILAFLVLSQAAFAYHNHTVGSDSIKTRDPSSVVKTKK